MKGFIEIKEDSYEDTIEHLYKIKTLACKLIKSLQEHLEEYDNEEDNYEESEEPKSRTVRKHRSRYEY